MPSRVGTNKCVGNRTEDWAGARSWEDLEAGLEAEALAHKQIFLSQGVSKTRSSMLWLQKVGWF